MTIKKYLTTPEEILALRHTDTKIYNESCETEEIYYQFVDGVLCEFIRDDGFIFNTDMHLSKLYILVEEPVKEVLEEDIGKLCWFWDFDDDDKRIGVLVGIAKDLCPYRNKYAWYQHCRRATPAEIAEITGYKVEE